MGKCGNQLAKCIICTGEYKVEEHQYGVIGCIKSRGKICPYVTVKYTNYGDNYMANFLRCSSRHKTGVKANKKKQLGKLCEKWNEEVVSKNEDEFGTDTLNSNSDMEIDNGKEKLA